MQKRVLRFCLVFEFQSSDAFEIASILGDENFVMDKSDGSNLEVRRTGAAMLTAQGFVFGSGGIVERQDLEFTAAFELFEQLGIGQNLCGWSAC